MGYEILSDGENEEIMETFGGDTELSYGVLAEPGQYHPSLPVRNWDGVDTRTLVPVGHKAVRFLNHCGEELVFTKHQFTSEESRNWHIDNIRRELRESCSVRSEKESSKERMF